MTARPQKRAFSAPDKWGRTYEVSACQTCGKASCIDPCRICRHEQEGENDG